MGCVSLDECSVDMIFSSIGMCLVVMSDLLATESNWRTLVDVTTQRGYWHIICEGCGIWRIAIEECSEITGLAVPSIVDCIARFQEQSRSSVLQSMEVCEPNHTSTGVIEWKWRVYVESSCARRESENVHLQRPDPHFDGGPSVPDDFAARYESETVHPRCLDQQADVIRATPGGGPRSLPFRVADVLPLVDAMVDFEEAVAAIVEHYEDIITCEAELRRVLEFAVRAVRA